MVFTTLRPLRFGDCDPSGIAYFPSYLHLLVGVTEEFFEALGFPWPALMTARGIALPTVRLDVTFSRPGRHGDMLEFVLGVRRIGTSSLDFAHQISIGGTLCWAAEQRVVATEIAAHRSCPWPDDIRSALEHQLEASHA